MAILSTIDRKTIRGRLLLGSIYLLLCLGGVLMVYPFLTMLGMSFANEVDVKSRALWPRYIVDEELLYRKFMATRYLSFQKFLEVRNLNRNYLTGYFSFEELLKTDQPVLVKADDGNGGNKMVPLDLASPAQLQRAHDFRAFVASLPESHIIPGALPWLTLNYQRFLKEKYRTGERMAEAIGETGGNFSLVQLPFYNPYIRTWRLDNSAKVEEWRQFFASQPEIYRIPLRMDGEYQQYLLKNVGGVQRLNQLSGQNHQHISEYRLVPTAPSNPVEASWWQDYVKNRLPVVFMEAESVTPFFQQWLAERYRHDISAYNARHGTQYRTFSEVPFTKAKPQEAHAAADWSHFLVDGLPGEKIRLDTVEARWGEWLKERYQGSLEALSKAHGVAVKGFDDVYLPLPEFDRLMVKEQRWALVKRYLWGNYALVADHLLINGRAFINTGILCIAMILSQLTINPFCAYALSRFSLSYRYKVILFLIATMAFPAEVLMIPNFLNLKNFGLLNTYWALILPSLVSGYYIFVMKGFFDSLGKEMYEAAQIDGAGEIRIFFQIVVPLSKPVFALKALNAFMAAYGGFMWAFLVCQDRKLWTVMVKLYEFQQVQPQQVVMATLVVASLPTLLVYIFCQRLIMRGIVLPTMK